MPPESTPSNTRVPSRSRRWALLLSLLGLGALISRGVVEYRNSTGRSTPKRHQLLIGSDGVSWEAFTVAQQRGLFRRFKSVGRMMAPYPTMSHPSWTEIIGTQRVFGARGNIRTVEARWFDLDAMRVADDPRQVMARQAGTYNYMRAFDTYFDPLVEPLMYFPGRKLFDRELDETSHDILNGYNGDRYAAYISGSDAIAHTHKDELFNYLAQLDSTLNYVLDSLEARGTPVDAWLVSDHGNVGAFAEGETERYLTSVSLDSAIKRAGLVRRDTGSVRDSNEVAIVTIALGSMANAYFPDLSRRRRFADEVLRVTGVSLVTWMEVRPTERVIVIRSPNAEAELRWKDNGYAYLPITGNPLAVPDSLCSTSQATKWVTDAVMRAATVTGAWPDAPYRLAHLADKQIENAPDMVVNLGDGYFHAGDLGKAVHMVRTHGSLSAKATFGIVASTHGTVPPYVRASEVLQLIGIDPHELLRHVSDLHPANAAAEAESLAHAGGFIATGHGDQSLDAEYLRRLQPIVQSMGYFGLSQLRYLLELVRPPAEAKPNAGESREDKVKRTSKLLGRVDVLKGLHDGIDSLIGLTDSIEPSQISTRVRQVEDHMRGIPALEPLSELRGIWSDGHKDPEMPAGSAVGVRRAAMAAWTLPYFLDAALDAPESDSIADPRDLQFAARWLSQDGARLRADPSRMLENPTLAATVFGQVFAERKLWQQVEPATVPLLYDPEMSNVTVALVPGIYGELFDEEIWQRSLSAVRDRLGVRTVTVPVDGRCSSTYNAPVVLQALRDDTRRRLERGYARPRYLLVGYSKGGTDATEALLIDSAFARAQVAALVTVATPHMGSPVAERAALPTSLVRMASLTPAPAACDTLGSAESLFPSARAAFWTANGKEIGGRTKLFSVSLVSSMHDAHPWMKVAKRIGQFTEENDGMVTVSASRFPASVPAIDLGRISGDHIAGRNASSFPQEAFMEALVVTMGELGVLEPANDQSWSVARQQWAVRHARDHLSVVVPSFARALRAPTPLPGGRTNWTPASTFRTYDASSWTDVAVQTMEPSHTPAGIDLRCDQQDMLAFRREYEFLYDAGNGGQEGDPLNGFALTEDPGSHSGRVCHLSTRQAAIKITTVSYRFRPVDFPSLDVHLRVVKNLHGVDPTIRKRGANDCAFKLWFVLQDTRTNGKKGSGGVRMFGYSWAASDADGNVPKEGSLLEATSSRRNLVVTTLPEAWLLVVGGPSVDGKWHDIQRNLSADIQRAYPGVPPDAFKIVGITVQTDSDESHLETEVLLDHIAIHRPVATR